MTTNRSILLPGLQISYMRRTHRTPTVGDWSPSRDSIRTVVVSSLGSTLSHDPPRSTRRVSVQAGCAYGQ